MSSFSKQNCRHGGDRTTCSFCLAETYEVITLRPFNLVQASEARGIAYRRVPEANSWSAVSLTWCAEFVTVSGDGLSFVEWSKVSCSRLIKWLDALSKTGKLFVPNGTGLVRGRSNQRCWACHTDLPEGVQRVGCLACGYCACPDCGACFSDFRGGWVYPGKNIPALPCHLKCSWAQRRVLVAAAGETFTVLKRQCPDWEQMFLERFRTWPRVID